MFCRVFEEKRVKKRELSLNIYEHHLDDDYYTVVPETGIEPVWKLLRRILSPVRLPIPPLGHK